MSWILIVMMVHTGGLAAMTSATFETREACYKAAAQWQKPFGGKSGIKALCHPSK